MEFPALPSVSVDEFVKATALLAKTAMNANALTKGCVMSMAESCTTVQTMGFKAFLHEYVVCEKIKRYGNTSRQT